MSRGNILVTPEGEIAFTVAHRPRVTRRMHLELDDDGGLLVIVPRDWPLFYTRRLLDNNLPFVDRFLRKARTRKAEPLRYTEGAKHLYRGKALTLRLFSAPRKLVSRQEDELCVRLPDTRPDQVLGALQQWYRKQALNRFQARLEQQQQRTPWARDRNLSLALRRMKRTWGTCSSTGVIRLNTHLIKAPDDSLDYVISHELCHLKEMNHGPRFYALQEALWPDWRAQRQHLREHGNRYTQE